MNPLRNRVHRLVDRLSDDDLDNVWMALRGFYYDSYILKSIQEAKCTLKPGDTLTREEAIQALTMP